MAASLVQQVAHAHNQTDANPDVSMSLTGVVAGNTLVLCTSTPQSGFKITGVTDSSGNTWTKLVEKVSGSSDTVQIWVAANVSAGTHTLTITWNASRNSALSFSEWSGLATSFPTPPTGSSSNASSTSAPSGTATPVSGSYLAIAALSTNTAGTKQADSYTSLTNAGSPLQNYGRWAYLPGVTAATSTLWTLSTADTSAGAIVLLQEAAGGVTKTQTLTCSSPTAVALSKIAQAVKLIGQGSVASVLASKVALIVKAAGQASAASVSRLSLKVFSVFANTSQQGQFPIILGPTGGPSLTTTKTSAGITKVLSASSATGAALVRRVSVVRSAAAATGASIVRRVSVIRSASAVSSSSVRRSSSRSLLASTGSSLSLTRFLAKVLSGSSSSSATVQPHISSSLTVTAVASVVAKPVMWFRRGLAIAAASITSLGAAAAAAKASLTATSATESSPAITPASTASASISPATETQMDIIPDEH